MSKGDWQAIAGLGAVVLVVGYFSPGAAAVVLGTAALVALFTHGPGVAKFFGLKGGPVG